MKAVSLNTPLNVHYIDNLYTENELLGIHQELEFLSKKLKGPISTRSYINDLGVPMKQNKGVFLDAVYSDRTMSDILTLNRKIFDLDTDTHDVLVSLKNSTIDNTLVSYYENGDYYKPHVDLAVLTVLTYFFKEPKAFEGGDLYLPDYGVTLPCINNRVYFLPSFIRHQVIPVKMSEENLNKNLGRYCMTQFLNYDTEKGAK